MSAPATYWRSLSLRSLIISLLGVFFVFSTIGFVGDLYTMGRQPALRFVLSVVVFGLFAAFYAFAGFALRKQSWKALVPALVIEFAVLNLLAQMLPLQPPPARFDAGEIARLQSRLSMTGLGMIVAIAAGYACFAYVRVTEGRRYFRVQAEMDLAAEIHRVLVTPIHQTIGRYEFYGTSTPSGQVGGDLIDLAGSEDEWVAYVADVSGHGVAPGVVMGMVKSAARMFLDSGGNSAQLLSRLNEVLYPLKMPDMFVTICFVAGKGDALRVGLGGHPAILHISPHAKECTQLESPNMPLGILPSADFETAEIRAQAGDLFALYTDGLLETANAAGQEFGRKRFQMELEGLGAEPLEVICRSLLESVARHGGQMDDRSLLLIRRLK